MNEPETIAQLPDAEIISRILMGEKKLFEILMRRYNQRLYRIGMSVLNNSSEVEDAMQAAYINAYEHMEKFEQRASFITWLTRIMLNQCFEQNRKHQLSRNTVQQPHNSIYMRTPDNILVNKELNSVLEQAIAKLPEKYRLVFMLREIEELSVKETSSALNIEEPIVIVRFNRAKTILRAKLSG